jgi:hypothetical protein
MAAAVAQHAAERKLSVAGELAAANGPIELVASGVSFFCSNIICSDTPRNAFCCTDLN